jgi:hypothetical protein
LSAGEKEQGRKGKWDGGRRLFMVTRWHDREEGGMGGPGFGAVWRGKRGRERGPGHGEGELGHATSPHFKKG